MFFNQILPTRASLYYCSKHTYGTPAVQDCYEAISTLPSPESFYRYFVEQQLTTSLSQVDWYIWHDPRPGSSQQSIIQIPKFWSYGG